ncbi:TRAP transporter small permease [Pontibaca salina]|uniref:TRAP transporter small permease protein n=1 Tax=Pontibaca salina TaxID=2795731 RepID=A0A934HQS4_9RHOB|nr:TRAP transporter small permease [Pontibaca salina]MBI6629211.1 TRAP transporter small permease [Pontibaca salina]
MAQFYRTFDRSISIVEKAILILALLVSTGVLIADIVLRSTVGIALSWSAELTRYAIVWMVFIGGSVAAREGSHISIDMLGEMLPPGSAKALGAAAMAVSGAGCAVLMVVSVQLVRTMMTFGQTSPALEVPMWWVYLALPVGFGLMSIRFVQAAADVATRDESLVVIHDTAA